MQHRACILQCVGEGGAAEARGVRRGASEVPQPRTGAHDSLGCAPLIDFPSAPSALLCFGKMLAGTDRLRVSAIEAAAGSAAERLAVKHGAPRWKTWRGASIFETLPQ